MEISSEKKIILKDRKHNIKVVAGPGSGKTTLIINKVKELVREGVSPKKILIITYTNKAAENLEKRISKEINKKEGFYVSTFHGFCSRFIRENPHYFKELKGYRIIDDLAQLLFIVKHINKTIRTEGTQNMSPLDLRNYFSRIKDNLSIEEINKQEHILKKSYLNYCNKLIEEKKLDFGDIINSVISTIEKNKSLKKLCGNLFDYIFIDEYQDINRNQIRLIKLFKSTSNKIMVVGDKNQSIFGFRGSDIRIFDEFDKTFNNTKTYYLKKNYRSSLNIINTSNKFLNLPENEKIVGNIDKSDGKLTSKGVKVNIIEYDDELSEAKETVQYIKNLYKEKVIDNYSRVAIILKSVKGDSKRFIEILEENKIPYEVLGDGGLFDLDYIKEILSCYQQIGENKKVVNEFLKIKEKQSSLDDTISLGPLAVFYWILENSEYFKNLILDDREEIIFNLGKFSKIISIYTEIFGFDRKGEYLKNFYDNIIKINNNFLDTEQPIQEIDNSVKILTLHRSKGLEFPIVILPGVNSTKFKKDGNEDLLRDLFPYYDPDKDLERAFYVGMTRAKNKLILGYFNSSAKYIQRLLSSESIKFENLCINNNSQSKLFKESEEKLTIDKDNEDKEPILLTYYKMIEFWKCPFAYKLRFHYNFLIPKNHVFSYGTVLHTILYHINLAIMNKEKYNLDELILKKTPPYMLKLGFKERIENYFNDFKDELKNIEAVEKPFEFPLGDSIINGRIDLLVKNKDHTFTIIEFKSGKSIDNEGDTYKIDEAKKQLNLYALSLSSYKINKGIIYFFGDRNKIIFDINKKQMELEIYDTITKIKKFDFKENINNCKKCVFKKYKICPYLKSNLHSFSEQEDILDDEYSDRIAEI